MLIRVDTVLQVYKNVSRKLRGSAQIWTKYCLFKLKNRQGQGEADSEHCETAALKVEFL
jgi:hypothetical protein